MGETLESSVGITKAEKFISAYKANLIGEETCAPCDLPMADELYGKTVNSIVDKLEHIRFKMWNELWKGIAENAFKGKFDITVDLSDKDARVVWEDYFVPLLIEKGYSIYKNEYDYCIISWKKIKECPKNYKEVTL